MTRAYVAMGGNMGDRLSTLGGALRALDSLAGVAVVAVSRVYESEPWPSVDQPAYANAVAVVETALDADVLLIELNEIERQFGRVEAERNAPRTIDLDIVLFGDEEWRSASLTIPHPRFAEREFVVVPLLEADPFAELPDGTKVSTTGAKYGRITGVLGVLPGFEDISRTAGEEGPHSFDRAEGWVAVAETQGQRMPKTPDVELIFKRTVLEQENIPYAWDPYAPEDASNPYGIEPVFRLMVPVSLADRARRILAEVEAAAPLYDDGSDLR